MLHSLNTPQDAAQWLRASVPGALRTDHRKVQKGDGFLAAKGQAVDARQGRVSQAFDQVGPTALAINRPIKIKMPSST